MKSSPKVYFTDPTSVFPCGVQKLVNKQKPDVSGKLLELMWIKKKMKFLKNSPNLVSTIRILPLQTFCKTANESSAITLLSIARCRVLYIA